MAAAPDSPPREMKVLCLGLPRTGTFSMYQALTMLGYKDVHHGLAAPEKTGTAANPAEWRLWSRACDASFPTLPTYTGVPLTRAEWDELFAPCEAVTDIASLFGEQLVRAYPEARVVLVERDADRWSASVEDVFQSMFSPAATFFMNHIEPHIGSLSGPVSRRMWSGWLGLGAPDDTTLDEKRRAAPARYRAHYARMRELVPEGRRLDYRLGDGWEPLCAFLGREVPVGVEFPRTNDAAAFRDFVSKAWRKGLRDAARTFGPWLVGFGALGLGALGYSRGWRW